MSRKHSPVPSPSPQGGDAPHTGDAFRWRSTEIGRFEGFSDAVFAFAVTLMVVSLEVPKDFGELLEVVKGFPAFAFCFAFLIWIWSIQHRFFRRYGLQDFKTIVLNSLLLFMVLFYVYPLKFLFRLLTREFAGDRGAFEAMVTAHGSVPDNTRTLMIIYSGGFIAIFFVFALIYRHALALADRLALTPREIWDTKQSINQHWLCVGVGVLSILLALAGWYALSGFCYGLIGPLFGFHGGWAGRKARERGL